MSIKTKFLILIITLVVLVFLSLSLGSVIIPFDSLKNIFLSRDHSSLYAFLIWEYRLPKMATLIFTGISLGLSGLMMQSLFRNPIAGPYVLGLSAGAGLFVAFVLLGGSLLGWSLGWISLSVAAALGSIFTLILILAFYFKLKDIASLLIIGLMLGIFSGAIIQILSFFSQAEALQKYVFWSMGNPGNIGKNELIFFGISVLILTLLSFFLIKSLNALLLGENYALSLGFSMKKNQLHIILISGILTGLVTAFVGPVAFVGLMVPHIARKIFKTQLHEILIPAVILIGAALLLLCDLIAQLPGDPRVLPLNGVTALLGAPLVIYLVYSRK